MTGLALVLAGRPDAAHIVFAVGTVPVVAALLVQVALHLRRGDLGLDIIAALAMISALAVGEALAAVVVAIMYAGGQLLESFAGRRAQREMTALLARAPRSAVVRRNGALVEVPLEDIAPADRVLVRRGDIVPVDGVAEGVAVLDEATLTGESLPVRHPAGAPIRSGAANVGDAFEMTASASAADSTFAGIVRLVEAAQRSKAPMSRLADRYAVGFLIVTVLLAGGAALLTGDPVRAVAVLVVATPCPLILAVPVALVAGVSAAARAGVLVKGAAVLEAMAKVRAIVLDKTGTLTEGVPRLVAIETEGGEDELLRLVASLDQASRHPVAAAIVGAAAARGLSLSVPADVAEDAGRGIEGTVEGHRVAAGGRGYLSDLLAIPRASLDGVATLPGRLDVWVAVDGRPFGRLVFEDPVRLGAGALFGTLREHGIRRVVLATGDRRAVAAGVADGLPFDAVHADLSPEGKVAVVAAERAAGPVMMVGDGVNDAPALGAADVGVAMGGRGSSATADAADAILVNDDVSRLVSGIVIAQRARRIALQSVVVGLGLSLAAMVAAAFGALRPVEGALVQEAIDVAVVLNALRALSGPERA